MGLNIKNREAHLMAEELSKLTGESMTTAVKRWRAKHGMAAGPG
jgi:hypothetical protein